MTGAAGIFAGVAGAAGFGVGCDGEGADAGARGIASVGGAIRDGCGGGVASGEVAAAGDAETLDGATEVAGAGLAGAGGAGGVGGDGGTGRAGTDGASGGLGETGAGSTG